MNSKSGYIKMKWLVFVLGTYLFLAQGDKFCGTSPENEPQLKFIDEPVPRRHTQKREKDWEPIRIHVEYHDFDLGSRSRNSYFKNEVMNATLEWFRSVIRVNPVEGRLKIKTDDCGGIPVPRSHNSRGVDADLVVYITTKNEKERGYVAYAGACALQATSPNNIIAGRAVVNKAEFSTESFETQMNVMVHEITHLLGFSSSMFRYFRNSKGDRYDDDELVDREKIRGYYKYVVKSPTVLKKAREVFKCRSLEGVELESTGGSGTAGSHWEMRVMFNDFMNSHIVTDPVYSSISMALLEDSGWYKINWDYTQDNLWGKGKGCSFHTEKCLEDGKPQFSEFCSESKPACDTFHLYKGQCNLSKFRSKLPSDFRYFDSPYVGGTNSFIDYCPYRVGYSNGSCRGTGSKKTSTTSVFHEVVGPNSRCFETTLVEKGWRLGSDEFHTACYEVVKCQRDRAYIRVWDEIVECPFTGGKVRVDGMTGYLYCPDSDVLCSDVPCMNGCFGKGKCKKGVCECNEGFGGDDCSIACHETCGTCDGDDSNDCKSCKDSNAYLSRGRCKCKSGYSWDGSRCRRVSYIQGTCAEGFHETETGECVKDCGPMCEDCDRSQGVCKECTLNSHQMPNGECWCDEGFIETGQGSCVAICPELCLDCNPKTNSCNSCVKNALLTNGRCHCAAGFSAHEGACVKGCSNLCLDCDMDYSSCRECSENAQLNQENQCECKKGYIETDKGCELSCGSLCKECDSEKGICLVCKAFTRFNENTGKCECLKGYKESSGECLTECHNSCAACEAENPKVCTQCKVNAALTDEGTCKCSGGYLMNETGDCEKECPELCTNCKGQKCTGCNSNAELDQKGNCKCKKGFEEFNGKCYFQCPDLCDTCSLTHAYCASCKGGAFKTESGLCKCPQGTTELKGQCVSACNDLCAKCSEDKTKCQTCVEGAGKDSEGFCKCKEGLVPFQQTCEPKCNSLCKYCDEKTNTCKACANFAKLTKEGSCKCQAGFERLGGHCDAVCQDFCTECSMCDGSLCTACVENAEITQELTCKCREGYYPTNLGTCEAKCPELCLGCDEKGCFGCDKNAYLMHGICYCKSGFTYQDGKCL